MLIVNTTVRPSTIHGLGLFAAEDIPAGATINVYDPRFTIEVPARSVERLPEPMRRIFYVYAWRETPDGPYYLSVDNARFTNHSSSPNMTYYKETRAVIALRDIRCGEEMTEDYREYDADFGDGPGSEDWVDPLCGASVEDRGRWYDVHSATEMPEMPSDEVTVDIDRIRRLEEVTKAAQEYVTALDHHAALDAEDRRRGGGASRYEAKEGALRRLRERLLVLNRVCPGCGYEVDPDTCGCGDAREGHDTRNNNHAFVPMNCQCLASRRAPR